MTEERGVFDLMEKYIADEDAKKELASIPTEKLNEMVRQKRIELAESN